MSEVEVDAVFRALGEPTRRDLIEALGRGRATPTRLAHEFPVTRQAVAKHLSTLERAGLVRGERAGREIFYELTPAPMREAATWMATVGGEWDERLRRLAVLLTER
jgi:ArsR family transcriptional regulator, cadmium/lead-responsive transcriptional repressor